MYPGGAAFDPHAGLIKVDHISAADVVLDHDFGAFQIGMAFHQDIVESSRAEMAAEQVVQSFTSSLIRHELVLVQVGRNGFDVGAILSWCSDAIRKVPHVDLPA